MRVELGDVCRQAEAKTMTSRRCPYSPRGSGRSAQGLGEVRLVCRSSRDLRRMRVRASEMMALVSLSAEWHRRVPEAQAETARVTINLTYAQRQWHACGHADRPEIPPALTRSRTPMEAQGSGPRHAQPLGGPSTRPSTPSAELRFLTNDTPDCILTRRGDPCSTY